MPSIPSVLIYCAECHTPKMVEPAQARIYPVQFCNKKCRSVYRGRQLRNRIAKPCDNCGTELSLVPARHKASPRHFCNKDCFNTFNRNHRVIKTCKQCQKEITAQNDSFCCRECQTAYVTGRSRLDPSKPKRIASVPCVQCGAIVKRRLCQLERGEVVFCSGKCARIAQPKPSTKVEVPCSYCRKTTYQWPSRLVHGRKYYCAECRMPAIRTSANRITQPCATCGKEYSTTFHQITKRGSRYCSKICAQSGLRTRRTPYAFYWRKIAAEIRARDGFVCQVCGVGQSRPQHAVHHIIPAIQFGFEEVHLANHPDNLITLCHPCHRRVEANPLLLIASASD